MFVSLRVGACQILASETHVTKLECDLHAAAYEERSATRVTSMCLALENKAVEFCQL
jgi:hypothetical protein